MLSCLTAPFSFLFVVVVTLITFVSARVLGPIAARGAVLFVRRALITFWLASLVLALLDRLLHRDWVHLYWSAHTPITCLFLCSGVLLATTWPDDASAFDAIGSSTVTKDNRRWDSASLFFAMVVSLGIAPLMLQIALPEDRPTVRETGHPVPKVFALAAWGFGGELPDSLWPIADEERLRGVGNLPREVTVPMGAMLVAAWAWIAFSALAVLGRCITSPRERRRLLLVFPSVLGVLALFVPPVWAPRTALFVPLDDRSGIWTSDPEVLRSFGPVLSAALACALLLALLLRPRSEMRVSCLPADTDT